MRFLTFVRIDNAVFLITAPCRFNRREKSNEATLIPELTLRLSI